MAFQGVFSFAALESQDIPKMTYLWLIIATVSLALLSWLIYNAFFHPLSAIPGPTHWAITPFFYARSVNNGQFAQKSLDLHSQYGPIVRVAPNQLSATTGEAWTKIFTYKSCPKSANWFGGRRPNGLRGIFDSPNSSHARFRQVFAQAFTDKALNNHSGLIDKHAAKLVEKLSELSKQGGPVNITDELEYATFDLAGDFAFSRSFECLQKADNRGEVTFLQQHFKRFSYFAVRRTMGVQNLAIMLGNFLTSFYHKRSQLQLGVMTWTRDRLATEHENEIPDLMDFITTSTRKIKTLLPGEAENSLLDFMLAGTETIATTVDAVLLNLVNHPEDLGQLRVELEQLEPKTPTHEDLGRMQLLNAIINETMRLGPSIPHALIRAVQAPGIQLGGYYLPEGVSYMCSLDPSSANGDPQTTVGFCQYAAYRDPANFSCPIQFDPQRWIDPAKYTAHNASIFNPFSVGPRNCIGKQWGLWAVRAIIAQIVLNFDMEHAKAKWEWEEQDSGFVWTKRDLRLNLKCR